MTTTLVTDGSQSFTAIAQDISAVAQAVAEATSPTCPPTTCVAVKAAVQRIGPRAQAGLGSLTVQLTALQ